MATRHGSILSSNDISALGFYEYNSSVDTVMGKAGGFYIENTPFSGVINGAPTSTSVVYDGEANELALKFHRGIVLHNTTKGERVYIEDIDVTTNTITVEANSPDDAGTWDNNDVITCQSQTNAEAGWLDVDVTPVISTALGVPLAIIMSIVVGFRNADNFSCAVHPYEAFNANKQLYLTWAGASPTLLRVNITVPLTAADSRYYFTLRAWNLAADNAQVVGAFAGQFTASS